MKKLPIGLNSLENIIKDGFLYVDKTKKIYELIEVEDTFFIPPKEILKQKKCQARNFETKKVPGTKFL